MRQTHKLFDYIAKKEDVIIVYINSNMKVVVHSNASYLSKAKERSRAGDHFFLSNKSTIPKNNGASIDIAYIIKHVMKSATEAKLAAL